MSRWYRIGNRNEELQQWHNENKTYMNKNTKREREKKKVLLVFHVRSPLWTSGTKFIDEVGERYGRCYVPVAHAVTSCVL